MWSRKELKEKSKLRMQANYWKCILIALLLSVIVGGGYSASGSGYKFSDSDFHNESNQELFTHPDDVNFSYIDQFFGSSANVAIFVTIVIICIIVVALIVCIVVIPLQIFVFNPLEVGCRRFFAKNLNEDAPIKEICYSFDNGYKGAVKTMFFRDLFIFLWSLLLVIPGIVKSYEYRMIPYILSENPGIDKESAFALSKKMMDGNKWNAFVLDLSFIGWHILSACTLGILGVFYVNPYCHQTEAALYEALKVNTLSENI